MGPCKINEDMVCEKCRKGVFVMCSRYDLIWQIAFAMCKAIRSARLSFLKNVTVHLLNLVHILGD